MNKIHRISMLTSFLGLWLTSFLAAEYQTILGFCLIFSFGILHGANDMALISRLKGSKNISFSKIVATYIVLVIVSIVFFLKAPIFALLFFVIISAYHFGEQNWIELLKNCNTVVKVLFQFSYGFLILTSLFYFNTQKVTDIIFKIAQIDLEQSFFSTILIISVFGYIVLALVLVSYFALSPIQLIEQSFYIVVLCIIFKVASLFLGFAIYFIFWHSIPSLYDQIKFLYGSYTIANFKKYFKSAFIYWLVSLMGIFVLYYMSKDLLIFDALFFSFLASITFPHFMIMLKMYNRN